MGTQYKADRYFDRHFDRQTETLKGSDIPKDRQTYSSVDRPTERYGKGVQHMMSHTVSWSVGPSVGPSIHPPRCRNKLHI